MLRYLPVIEDIDWASRTKGESAMSTSLLRMVEQQVRRWELQQQALIRDEQAVRGVAPVITVSRTFGAGGGEIARPDRISISPSDPE